MSKANTCKVCGKDVEYWSVPKPNGKTRFYAFHVGDAIPEGSVKFDPAKISGIHKMRRRKELEEKCTQLSSTTSASIDQPVETTTPIPDVDEPVIEVIPEVIHRKPKEVILPKEDVIESLTELHETPSISAGKPVLDISDMKRNRFAIVGAIARTMTSAGTEEAAVNTARSVLISKGKDFPSLIHAAAPYMQFTENGHPITFQ